MYKKIAAIALFGLLGFGGTIRPAIATKVTADSISPAASVSNFEATVKLLSPGASARQVLRYKPVVNTKQAIAIGMKMSSKTLITGLNRESSSDLQAKAESTITQIDPNGDIHYAFRYLDWTIVRMNDLPASALEPIQARLKQLSGLNIVGVMNGRGQVKKLTLENKETVDRDLSSLLEQFMQSMRESSSIPLPEEAVGVGAKWQVTQPVQAIGLSIVQTSTYELLGLQDGVMTLKRSVVGQATPGTANLFGSSAIKVNVKAINTVGQDQIVLRRDRIIPQKQQSTIKTQVDMDVNLPNSETASSVASRSETTLEVSLESQ
jgi:hypothetical protein